MKKVFREEAASAVSLIDELKLTIRQHERFVPIMLALAEIVVAQYERKWLLNRLFNDRGRFISALAILHLHYQGLRFGTSEGLTATRLKQICSQQGICSPGRATALLSTMRFAGLIKTVRTSDNRQKVLVPSPEFIDLHRTRVKRMLGMIEPFMPRQLVETYPRYIDDDIYMCAIADVFMKIFVSGFRLLAPEHPMRVWIDRDGGLFIAFSLMLATSSPSRTGETAATTTVSELAERFCLSRSHVTGVLRDAEQAGLISRNTATGVIVLRPAFNEAMTDLFSSIIALHMHCVSTATTIMLEEPQAATPMN